MKKSVVRYAPRPWGMQPNTSPAAFRAASATGRTYPSSGNILPFWVDAVKLRDDLALTRDHENAPSAHHETLLRAPHHIATTCCEDLLLRRITKRLAVRCAT